MCLKFAILELEYKLLEGENESIYSSFYSL